MGILQMKMWASINLSLELQIWRSILSDALVNIEVSFKELNRAPFWSPTVIPSNVKETNSDDTSKSNQSKENSESKNRRRRRRW